MILYIALKDIRAFFRSEKPVFLWLIFCLICGSFVLNYSYSFARYRGEIYEYNSGASIARYQIVGSAPTNKFNELIERISKEDLPEIQDYQLFNMTSNGNVIVGSSFISKKSAAFTGIWREGYAAEISPTELSVCAINSKLLDYNGRLTMTGEKFMIDNEEFVIRGVFEMSNNADIVIFADKFIEKYDGFDKVWITFAQRLSAEQEQNFSKIIKNEIPDCNIIFPPAKGKAGSDIVKSNELQYTAIIIMLIICLVSIIKYWQTINISTYTIYWISGASNGKIMLLALCECLVLCVCTYLAGLGINALSRAFLSKNAPLEPLDIIIGFGVYFSVFTVFVLINTARICKTFSAANVRSD